MKNWIKTLSGEYVNLNLTQVLDVANCKVFANVYNQHTINTYPIKEFDNDKDAQDYLDDLMRDDDYETFISSEDFGVTKSKLVQLDSDIAVDPDKVVGVEIRGYDTFYILVACDDRSTYNVGKFSSYEDAVKDFKRVVNLINNH